VESLTNSKTSEFLGKEDWVKLLEFISIKHFKRGEIIVEQNQPFNSLSIVQAGSCRVFRYDEKKGWSDFGSLVVGDVIGTGSWILPRTREPGSFFNF
jgi:CRP-like cAMP-binding protein